MWERSEREELALRYRMMGTRTHAIAAVVGGLLLAATPAAAIELGDWVPGLKFSPFITERVDYETNVFQARTNTEDDFSSRTVPGFTLSWEGGPLKTSTGLRFEILRFLELTRQDNEHVLAFGDIRVELPKLRAGVRDDFTHTSDPPGAEIVERLESTINVFTTDAEYKFTSRLSAGVSYAWTHVNFERRVDTLDRNEHLGTVSVFWRFLREADLRLSYSRGATVFNEGDGERDISRNVYAIGVRGDLTPKLSSTLRYGYEEREREGTSTAQRAGNTFIIGGDLVFKPTDKLRLSLLADRSFQESTFAESGFFVATTGTLLAEYRITPKITTNARFTASENDYPSKERVAAERFFKARNDTLLGWGGGLEYEIAKWLLVGGEYSHSRRDSNFETFDYRNDKFSAKITLQF